MSVFVLFVFFPAILWNERIHLGLTQMSSSLKWGENFLKQLPSPFYFQAMIHFITLVMYTDK